MWENSTEKIQNTAKHSEHRWAHTKTSSRAAPKESAERERERTRATEKKRGAGKLRVVRPDRFGYTSGIVHYTIRCQLDEKLQSEREWIFYVRYNGAVVLCVQSARGTSK